MRTVAILFLLTILCESVWAQNTRERIQNQAQITRGKKNLERNQKELQAFQAKMVQFKEAYENEDAAQVNQLKAQLIGDMKREIQQTKVKLEQAKREDRRERRDIRQRKMSPNDPSGDASVTRPLMLGYIYLGLTITDFLIICGTFIGALLGSTLLFVRSRNKWSNKLLALLIWSILLYLIPGFLDRFELLSEFPHLLGIQRLSGYLIGPLIFFYVKSNLVEGFSLKRNHLLHLQPFAIDLLYNLSYFLQTGTSKLSAYPDEIQNISFSIPALIKSIHAVAYLLLSLKQIKAYKKPLKQYSFYHR